MKPLYDITFYICKSMARKVSAQRMRVIRKKKERLPLGLGARRTARRSIREPSPLGIELFGDRLVSSVPAVSVSAPASSATVRSVDQAIERILDHAVPGGGGQFIREVLAFLIESDPDLICSVQEEMRRVAKSRKF